MTQVLLGTLMDTLNSGSLRGRCSVTHDLRNPNQPRVTAHESTTMLYPWVQGYLETFTLDPRLLQLKFIMTGRLRIRCGYAWGTGSEKEQQQPSSNREASDGGTGAPAGAGAGPPRVKDTLSSTHEECPPHHSVYYPVPPPPASAIWDAPGKDGRPVGFMNEGPFSTDSFLVGLCLCGDDFKCADRLPGGVAQREGEQYGYFVGHKGPG